MLQQNKNVVNDYCPPIFSAIVFCASFPSNGLFLPAREPPGGSL
jgi:hypothetical protein